jgi:hypothetical protein
MTTWMELCNVLYDDICDNCFTANLYNAVTMPVGLFLYRQSSTLWQTQRAGSATPTSSARSPTTFGRSCWTKAGGLRPKLERLPRSRSLAGA